MAEFLPPIHQVGNQGWLNESDLSTNLHLSLDEPWGDFDDDETYAETITDVLYGDEILELQFGTPIHDGPFDVLDVWLRGRKSGGSLLPWPHWTLTDAEGATLQAGDVVLSSSETYADHSWHFFGNWSKSELTGARFRIFNGRNHSAMRLTAVAMFVDVTAAWGGIEGHEAVLDSSPQQLRAPRRYFVFPY